MSDWYWIVPNVISLAAITISVANTVRSPERRRAALADMRWGIRRATIENSGGHIDQGYRPSRHERRAYNRTKRNQP